MSEIASIRFRTFSINVMRLRFAFSATGCKGVSRLIHESRIALLFFAEANRTFDRNECHSWWWSPAEAIDGRTACGSLIRGGSVESQRPQYWSQASGCPQPRESAGNDDDGRCD